MTRKTLQNLVQSGRKAVSKSALLNFGFKRGLKRQSGIKLPVKPTWSEKMTVLSPFLEASLNFLFNNLQNLVQSKIKACQSFNCQKHKPHSFSSSMERAERSWRHDDVIWQNPNLANCQITSLWRQNSSARSMELENE